MNGADILCDTLLDHGVDVCFANPGTSEMHFVAALDRKREMRCVLGLFEGVVTGAADGYARMADKPAATLLHLGPGLANGLANLHNARRARSPMINVVGDHASWHLANDAPLTSDIESLAHPMSHFVRRIVGPDDVAGATAEAWRAAVSLPGVATLILPGDAAWTDVSVAPARQRRSRPQLPAVGSATVEAVAKAMRDVLAHGGRVDVLISQGGLREAGLAAAGRLGSLPGLRVLAPGSSPRMQRGQGRVTLPRIPYPIDMGMAMMRDTDLLVLAGATVPVGFFAYPGKSGKLLRDDAAVTTLATAADDVAAALEDLARALDARTEGGAVGASQKPQGLPSGRITPEVIGQVVGALLPDNAIICDEAITASAAIHAGTVGAPPHDYIQLTGGAIGLGIPMAVGAAVACPDRKVVAVQADGSAMYTIQGLWTQAREALDIVTIVVSNRAYSILQHEMRGVGINNVGEMAGRMLSLDRPDIDFVGVARGLGVEGGRAETAEELASLLRRGLAARGPFLIEAVV
jgi:acetolactate synthase-1/2/3 large subunit